MLINSLTNDSEKKEQKLKEQIFAEVLIVDKVSYIAAVNHHSSDPV